MSGVAITSLSLADVLDGTEVFPIIQGGSTKKSTTQLLITYAATNVSAATVERIDELAGLVSVNTESITSVNVVVSTLQDQVNALDVSAVNVRLDAVSVLVSVAGADAANAVSIAGAVSVLAAGIQTQVDAVSVQVSTLDLRLIEVSAATSALQVQLNAVSVKTSTISVAVSLVQVQVASLSVQVSTISVAVSVLRATKVSISAATIWNPTITNYVETAYIPASVSSYAVSLDQGTIQRIYTIGANTCISLPAAVAGKSFVVIVYYGGAHAITWTGGTLIKWPGGSAPTASSSATAADIFTFFQDTSATYGNQVARDY